MEQSAHTVKCERWNEVRKEPTMCTQSSANVNTNEETNQQSEQRTKWTKWECESEQKINKVWMQKWEEIIALSTSVEMYYDLGSGLSSSKIL